MSKPYIGVKNGRLSDCPKSPNCVSTQTDQEEKKMTALAFSKDLETTKSVIKKVLSEMERTAVETETENYIHAVVESKWMKFKDDVEFYFDQEEEVIHFRSASRVGHSDFGVNKKRMKAISEHYESMRRESHDV
ncbi:DUF1499 domain-containing protein [Halobacillus sp. SY10]|uniref:Uncharacterized conserved protein, DUF1499 family n=2 Tax=Halobacillus TaxID=45667 RepID=A0A1H0R1Y2_HALAD|nr:MULTISPECIES: DUF1499 domain-containing protein [Halobacillus]RDY70245.1 DUF1499 domain-containing protein [Halobacillus trueperi]SDP22998.1 Uncharacterized conserved protein, DUF1499 family [Halobacillus aidingensis]